MKSIILKASGIFLATVLSFSAFAGYGDAKDKAKEMAKSEMDVVDIAASDENFSTLVAAVKAAGLVEALKADGPITVFVPTNEAFAKLPAGTVENLLKPENKDQLIEVLTYHVVPGKVTASDVVMVDSANSLQGQAINVTVDGDKVMVNDATVIQTDIDASNGVIHVIDTVILPQS
ncbi:fasciclin domain-containing protein [Ningiella sp. W23]|uniref:fasciclin domain-containing protein n=1 Tax=Ningiella sp. W23 TaxID=3023715 RepID=UPI003756CC64